MIKREEKAGTTRPPDKRIVFFGVTKEKSGTGGCQTLDKKKEKTPGKWNAQRGNFPSPVAHKSSQPREKRSLGVPILG